jgi:hypothetical protein
VVSQSRRRQASRVRWLIIAGGLALLALAVANDWHVYAWLVALLMTASGLYRLCFSRELAEEAEEAQQRRPWISVFSLGREPTPRGEKRLGALLVVAGAILLLAQAL